MDARGTRGNQGRLYKRSLLTLETCYSKTTVGTRGERSTKAGDKDEMKNLGYWLHTSVPWLQSPARQRCLDAFRPRTTETISCALPTSCHLIQAGRPPPTSQGGECIWLHGPNNSGQIPGTPPGKQEFYRCQHSSRSQEGNSVESP